MYNFTDDVSSVWENLCVPLCVCVREWVFFLFFFLLYTFLMPTEDWMMNGNIFFMSLASYNATRKDIVICPTRIQRCNENWL